MTPDPASFTLLDGPLLPNDALELAEAMRFDAPDDLAVAADGALLVSDGVRVMRLAEKDARPVEFACFDKAVTAMCALEGDIIIAVDGGGLFRLSLDGAAQPVSGEPHLQDAVTACSPTVDGGILVARATTTGGVYPYTNELFSDRGSGQIWKVSADGHCVLLANGLRGPHGVVQSPSGDIAIAETWNAAVKVLGPAGALSTALSGFAGYPGRLRRTASGSLLMACLSRRDPLVDFVRAERAFAARMTRNIDPAHWIAPRLESGVDVNVPAQAGATRLFGETKPWAPSLSYGLMVTLNDDFVPESGYHSRANGVRHGVVSAIEWKGRFVAVSRATREVLFVRPGSRA